jgi:hypothetical protein
MDFHDFTIFDVFYKNKQIYLILSINNDPVDDNKLYITTNSKRLQLNEKIIKINYEPTMDINL